MGKFLVVFWSVRVVKIWFGKIIKIILVDCWRLQGFVLKLRILYWLHALYHPVAVITPAGAVLVERFQLCEVSRWFEVVSN